MSASAAPGVQLRDILLPYDSVHPDIAFCIERLGGNLADVEVNEMISEADIDEMRKKLQPAITLADAVASCEQRLKEQKELSSSPADNFNLLTRLLRSSVPSMYVSEELRHLFDKFSITYAVTPEEQEKIMSQQLEEEENGPVSQRSDSHPTNRHIQRRLEEEDREVAIASSQVEEVAPEDAVDEEGPQAMSADGDDGPRYGVSHQLKLLKIALQANMMRWVQTFPKPEKRVWSKDFDKAETKNVREHIRKWILASGNRVDITLGQTQPKEMTDACVTYMLADDEFPVIDAKTAQVISQEFRSECKAANRRRLKAQNAQDELEEDAQDEDEDGSTTAKKGKQKSGAQSLSKDQGKGNAKGSGHDQGRGKGKRTRRATSNDEDDEDKRPPSKKTRADTSAPYGAAGPECATCFFSLAPCAIVHQPGTYAEQTTHRCESCTSTKTSCRVLCDMCAETANARGRGSGLGSLAFLLTECEDCEFD
jgi:hypothetical protein